MLKIIIAQDMATTPPVIMCFRQGVKKPKNATHRQLR